MSASVAMLAMRIWWPIIAVLTVLGAVGGFLAVRDAPYVAVTTLRVDTAGFGEVAQESIVETSRLLVDSNRTYRIVVGDAPGAVDEIRARTAVDVIATSSVLELAVSAQTAAQAEFEVEALAEASISAVREIAADQFTETVSNGQQSLDGGVLRDPVAEQARRDALGVALAEQQDNALRLSASLTRIGEVAPATRVGLGARLAGLIGALGGCVVGAAVALFLGVGRRRARSLADLRVVSPALVDCEPLARPEGIARVAAECSRLAYPLVVVLALPGAEAAVQDVSAELRSELYRDGSRPFRLEYADVRHASAGGPRPPFARSSNDLAPELNGGITPSGSGHLHHARPVVPRNGSAAAAVLPALGMPNRAADLSAADADLLLVTADADARTLQQIGGRADVVLLVGQRGQTRLGELARVVELLRPAGPPVIVLADSRTATAALDTVAPAAPATPRPGAEGGPIVAPRSNGIAARAERPGFGPAVEQAASPADQAKPVRAAEPDHSSTAAQTGND